MGERQRVPQVIADIAAQRDKQAAVEQSVAEARARIPIVRAQVAQLLLTHFPPLDGDVPAEVWEAMSVDERVSTAILSHFQDVAARLDCTIPDASGEVVVTISSNIYPIHHPRTPQDSGQYVIDAHEQDHILVLNSGVAVVDAKAIHRSNRAPLDPMHTKIGGRQQRMAPPMPAWSRPATLQDIQEYEALLEYMAAVDTQYEPTTFTPSGSRLAW